MQDRSKFAGTFESWDSTNALAHPIRISVFGATGSIGASTFDVLDHAPEGVFEVVAVTANTNAVQLAERARKFRAAVAVVGDRAQLGILQNALAGSGTMAAAGPAALLEAAQRETDCVVAAITGAAGLAPTLAAMPFTKRIALANKECLVVAGTYFMSQATAQGVEIVPVDSEHSAVFQCLIGESETNIEMVTITASGGPFRTWSAEEIDSATREQALRHPNWSMGDKITIDSATLMNKGLELIEASHLFSLPPAKLSAVIHPQSVVHGLVRLRGGSVMAQLGSPDMRIAIGYGLSWPDRIDVPVQPLDITAIGSLTFEAVDTVRFPAFRLACEAMDRGGTASTVLNAANEVAVARFLRGQIGFGEIARVVAATLDAAESTDLIRSVDEIDGIMEIDQRSRGLAETHIQRSQR